MLVPTKKKTIAPVAAAIALIAALTGCATENTKTPNETVAPEQTQTQTQEPAPEAWIPEGPADDWTAELTDPADPIAEGTSIGLSLSAWSGGHPAQAGVIVVPWGVEGPAAGECGFDEARAGAAAKIRELAPQVDEWRVSYVEGADTVNAEGQHVAKIAMGDWGYGPVLVRAGWAKDTGGQYAEDQTIAQQAGSGLWASCWAE